MNLRLLPLFQKVAIWCRLGFCLYKLVSYYLILAAVGKILEPPAPDDVLKFDGI